MAHFEAHDHALPRQFASGARPGLGREQGDPQQPTPEAGREQVGGDQQLVHGEAARHVLRSARVR
ncbi:hypothetical protein ACWDBO_47565 [Streptomyces mirabilis]|uniref:hypothetical protein n=1 Tax=Streptomyces mirabilis TaxID=68239 RepID=UPI003328BE0D